MWDYIGGGGEAGARSLVTATQPSRSLSLEGVTTTTMFDNCMMQSPAYCVNAMKLLY